MLLGGQTLPCACRLERSRKAVAITNTIEYRVSGMTEEQTLSPIHSFQNGMPFIRGAPLSVTNRTFHEELNIILNYFEEKTQLQCEMKVQFFGLLRSGRLRNHLNGATERKEFLAFVHAPCLLNLATLSLCPCPELSLLNRDSS